MQQHLNKKEIMILNAKTMQQNTKIAFVLTTIIKIML